jgi:hypothetical protein
MEPGDSNSWERLIEAAQRGEEQAEHLILAVLAEALVRRGYGAIAADQPQDDGDKTVGLATKSFGFFVVWGLGISLASLLSLSHLMWPLAIVAVIVGLLLLARATGESPAVFLLVVLLWLIVGILEVAYGDFGTWVISYLGPLLILVMIAIATRSLRLQDAQDAALAIGGVVKAGPLIAPIVLLFLFLPALSADVWQVATNLSLPSYLGAAVLSIGLLLVVVRLQMGSQIQAVLSQRSAHLSDDAHRAELTRKQASPSISDDGRAVLDSVKDPELDATWPNSGEDYAPFLSATEGSALQAPLTARLIVTAGCVGILLTAYIYALCSVVVPADTVHSWTRAVIPATEVFGVTLHGGPYLQVASLLGIAATATFLSFALIEDRFAAALTNALLQDPADQFLVLALPYLALRESRISMAIEARTTTYPSSDEADSGGGS